MHNWIEVDPTLSYACLVQYYAIGHSELGVWIRSSKSDFFVHFRHVLCFSGPMRWKDLVFRVGTNEEYFQFIREMGNYNEKTDQELLDRELYGWLFIFEGQNTVTRLIAHGFSVSQKLDERNE